MGTPARPSPRLVVAAAIVEELGLALTLGAELVPDSPASAHWPLTETLEMRLWLATVAGGELSGSTDHDRLRWVGAAGLTELDWLPGDRAVVEALRSVLRPALGPRTSPDVP